ncbi:MAG: helix-turn-helix domain-containing protein [Nitrospiraceae bacterium]|nr:helix-turn-helix domain-containing protein [Nitrospiraceae bacterium]
MFLQRLGGRVRARREKLGLKQQDVANALDLSPQAVSKWERGENAPDVTVLHPLARLLGVSVDWLLAGNEEGRDTFEAAVLMSAINGAHERSLGMAPRDYALWLNGVFHQVTEIALRYDGVPVKYVGDGFLCFFSGSRRHERALKAALDAVGVTVEDVRVGLSSGPIYLGAVGHPDYARSDIMGQVVNIAFLTQQWASGHAPDGVAATQTFVEAVAPDAEVLKAVGFGDFVEADFEAEAKRVRVCSVETAGSE